MDSKYNRVEQYGLINTDSNHQDYTRDYGLSDAISTGDSQLLEEVTQGWYDQADPFMTSPWEDVSQIEWLKLQLKCLNKSCRVAAYEGECVSQSIYLLYKKFNILIDNGQSIDYLNEQIFYVICQSYCEAVHRLSTKNLTQSMKDIVFFINEHLTHDLTLQIIADQFDLHPVHLARKFKKEMGFTFIEYVNYQKVEYAKYLFYLDQYSLSDVAFLAGFNSHSYFTKVFKKVSGITPTQFVKENLVFY